MSGRNRRRGASAATWTVVLGALVLVLAAALVFQMSRQPRSPGIPAALEIAGDAESVTSVLDPETGLLVQPVGELLDRDFEERSGSDVTTGELGGSMVVASLIFTNCPGICAPLTREMAGLQGDLDGADDVRLVTISVDPERDTAEILDRYAESFGADEDWWFLRGDVDDTTEVVLGGLRFDGDAENPLFHSEHVALIDHQGRVRAFYRPLADRDWRTRIARAIEVLRDEDANRTDLLDEPAGELLDFPTIERSGEELRTSDYLGDVLVVDYVFTKCAGTCPMLTGKMAELQGALGDRDDVRLLTFTVDPRNDSPEVLAAYADEHGADPERWKFLFLNEGQVLQMAHDGMGIGSPTDARVHSGNFMLLDRQGRVRGKYRPLSDDRWMEKLLRAIDVLRAEP